MRYRPDIDGLRAVAVMAVVAYHAGVPFTSGGYVGVDVFFVISGYLITQILVELMRTRRDWLLVFYERRVRRILPALVPVFAVCILVGYRFLLPDDYTDLSKSLFAAAAFLANVYFWDHSGYFDGVAEEKPLLHTWSLAVEEQFYIVFPVVLFLALRASPRVRAWLLGGAALASLAAAEWFVRHDASSAFYLAPFRAWELLLGAALAGAAGIHVPARWRTPAGLAGLAAIAVSVLAYSPETPFPGLAALLPCLGTVALIWAGSAGPHVAGRWLSWRPVVAVGLISYSLYLWHWPPLAFARYMLGPDLPVSVAAASVVGAFVLAALSYRFVEQPFRRRLLPARRQVLWGGALALTAWMVFGLAGYVQQGWPGRFPPIVQAYAAGVRDTPPRRRECHTTMTPARVAADDVCRLGPRDGGDPQFILWGDSHADAWRPAFDRLAKDYGVRGLAASYSGCLPNLGARIVRTPPTDKTECQPFNKAMVGLVARSGVREVVLTARWPVYLEGYTGKEDSPVTRELYMVDAVEKARNRFTTRRVFQRSLERLVIRLQALGTTIWLVGAVPEAPWRVPRRTSRMLLASSDFGMNAIRIPDSFSGNRSTHWQQIAECLVQKHNVRLLDPRSAFCDGGFCQVADRQNTWYTDDDHLSVHGAMHAVPVLRPFFEHLAGFRQDTANLHETSQ